jgi:CubicO group peptidase (beta-lactamase class C family)
MRFQARFFLFGLMLTALLLAGCSTRSITQTPTPTPMPPRPVIEPEAISRLDAKLAQMTQDGTFGGSVLIAQDGKILLSKGYRLADRAQGIPDTPQTRFHLGSMTKPFTALGLLILQSQGKLSVQDPICNFFEDCPKEWQDITIHHLLTHTSGLSAQLSDQLYRAIESGASGPVTPADQAQYLGLTSQWSLGSTPGEQVAYNNCGYILVAHIIEEVSGQSYADYLNQAIFTPLNMHNTGYPDGSNGEEVIYYHDGLARTGGKVRPLPVSDGAGGLHSSSEDLFLWDQALYVDQLMPKSETDQIFEPFVPPTDIPGFDEAYRWLLGESQGQPVPAFAGGGEGSPFGTLIARFPQNRLTVIVLANQYIDQINFWGLISDELFGVK